MLAEQYAELKGEITSQRVLDVDEVPIIETSVLINGTMKGLKRTRNGNLHWYSNNIKRSCSCTWKMGVMTATMASGGGAGDGGGGRSSPSGNVKIWCGFLFFKRSSGSKLAFLNNMVGVSETDIDVDGNFSEKVWEWK